MTCRVVVMGVSGSGKSTVASVLAARRSMQFVEGDDLHPPANIAKMAAGVPLDDDDRWPWLAALRQALRSGDQVVVTCSALTRSYRDALRSADQVRFIYLVIDPEEAARRVAGRSGHFMGVGMVKSQYQWLEPPGSDESDVASVDASGDIETVVDAVESALANLSTGTAVTPSLAVGGLHANISPEQLHSLVARIATNDVLATGARRILLVPPDHSRLHSRAGEITGLLFEILSAARCEVGVLPALGTHAAMDRHQVSLLFGDRIPFDRIMQHHWRLSTVHLGTIGAPEVAALSGGTVAESIPVEVSTDLMGGWDLVVSVGQVVPHEVIGMSNFSKNLVVGLGGAATINLTHYLGAVCGMEEAMGHAHGPVRDVVDAAFDRLLAPRLQVLWILTVVEDTPHGVAHRGLFVGRGRSGESGGAAFRSAADLSERCNIELVSNPLPRVSCWLHPTEFDTTWLANKAVYRTRMAIADGGELVVLAPRVTRFSEDPMIDALIRRHGYRGTPATLAAVRRDPELADDLGAAAHLIHGSSEGRFRIVYCTDPADGGLTSGELDQVGYHWRSLPEELERLGVTADTRTGPRIDRDGRPFTHIASPALGLWATSDRFARAARQ